MRLWLSLLELENPGSLGMSALDLSIPGGEDLPGCADVLYVLCSSPSYAQTGCAHT